MHDILDLDGWTVLARAPEDGSDILEAEYRPEPDTCPRCGTIGQLYKWGTKPTTYLDAPNRGVPAKLRAVVKRYKCRSCGATFLQPLGGIRTDRRMTERCASFIFARCLRDTFVHVADEVGCDDWTIRSVTADLILQLGAAYKPELPAWLGIDETQIDGTLRLVLTDLKERKPIEMLVDHRNATLATWLGHFPDRSIVEVVSTDMHAPYARVVEQLLPGVPLVVDKFHVVRMANNAMDDIRLRVASTQAKEVGTTWKRHKGLLRMRHKNLSEKGKFNLQMWLDNDPEVGTAYRLKESFYDIYDAPTKADARRLIAEWRDAVPANMRKPGRKEFAPLMSVTRNWVEQILAYWDFSVTNGYTEAFNGVAKKINRAGTGYSFEVLRARVLFGDQTKHLDRTWLLQGAAPPQVGRLWAVLRHDYGSHCGICFARVARDTPSTPVGALLRRGTEKRWVQICRACEKGFHTHGLTHPRFPSTR